MNLRLCLFFQLSEHNFHIKRINGDLGSAKTRDRGITALQAYLSQCPDETFNANCINWMTHCCKNVDGDPKSIISACQTLRKIEKDNFSQTFFYSNFCFQGNYY